jgi:hypothetical protein
MALVAFLVLAVVTGCGGGRPGPTEPAGSGVPSTLAERPGGRDLVARLRHGGHVIFIAGGPSLVARITAEEWQSLAQQG